MKHLRRYNESTIIKATDSTIWELVINEIFKVGYGVDLNHIDVSGVTNMTKLFRDTHFNGNISCWDMSNVISMISMFFKSKFNGDISRWDVQNVKNMRGLFESSQFNGDISRWNVKNVMNMGFMFYRSPFNGDLSGWNVQNVKEMGYAFYDSPLDRREPWWYILRWEFIDNKSMYDSIEVYEWIDFKRGIIWKKRLNYAFQDFGKVGSQIPDSIWGFTIQ